MSLRYANDLASQARYKARVSKTRPKRYTNWYLRDWMRTLKVSQTELCEKTDLNKTTMSLLVNDKQDYSPIIVRDIARALNLAPYELFLHPKDAADLKKLMADAEGAADLGRRLKLVSDKTGTDG